MTAHPDDENNAALALYARHVGARVALVTATRGDGGQNEIGTELFDALGVLRTEELLTAHRFDGAEQYFTRAVDFGYSFSQEETLEKWGRQEILGDFVRHIRTLRPDVIVTMSPDGKRRRTAPSDVGGACDRGVPRRGRSGAVPRADARRPASVAGAQALSSGGRLWRPRRTRRPGGPPGAGPGRGQRGGGQPAGQPPAAPQDGTFANLDTNVYEPLLGCTIGEVGGVASGMHMCQGRVPMVAPPSASSARYRLFETTLPKSQQTTETSLFQGIDVSLAGLARYAGDRPPAALVTALGAIASRIDSATRALDSRGPVGDGAGPRSRRSAPSAISPVRPPRWDCSDDARYEIDLRLRLKEGQLQDAIVLAQALRIEATANDGLVVAGQRVAVSGRRRESRHWRSRRRQSHVAGI